MPLTHRRLSLTVVVRIDNAIGSLRPIPCNPNAIKAREGETFALTTALATLTAGSKILTSAVWLEPRGRVPSTGAVTHAKE